MVDVIDIHSLTLEELSGVVDIYPWFGAARALLCKRMHDMGAMSDSMLAQTALHIVDRRILYKMMHSASTIPAVDYKLARAQAEKEKEERTTRKQVYVAGGDYFSQSQYNEVKKGSDNIFSSFASKAREEGGKELESSMSEEFCTETLAEIYLEQGYISEAKKIYSKLSLRYPEKSVYFASLIEKLDWENNKN